MVIHRISPHIHQFPTHFRTSLRCHGKKTSIYFLYDFVFGIDDWCALAQSMTSFIIARAVCGLGAGGVMSMGSIITSDLIPIEIRGAYQSYLNIVFGIGAASGAALGGCDGGFILDGDGNLGFRGKKTLKEALSVFDYKGSLLLMATITFFILAINLGGNIYPWTHPLILTCIILTIIGLPLFIITEYYASQPVMPLSLITHNPRGSLIIGNALGAIVINAVLFNIPLYFQAVLLESPTASGLRLIIPSIAASAIGTLTGFLITWTRNLKTPLVLGVSLYVIGTIGLVAMNRSLPNWVYVLLLIPSSMGQGFQMPGSFMSVLAVSEQGEQAVVTTTLVLWRSMGQVLGVAVSSLIVQNSLVGFLNTNVVGPDKEKVIEAVRSSVQAVAGLEPHYRDQVIDSYAEALKAAYVFALVVGILSFAITIGIKLPKLGFRK
ncbi:uncharacterized protein EAF02_010575 [Botrytis sinoallii]|uniref:uncharacterized protein n=1 Tax=Botrytis sinoallii TaxID=1463999 RepID=UPI001901B78C|nr:uncharacterized protein EAF02_010575 [Botrytis sinoallii]KAF7861621.1 hypothetical protein EAF02_010575 [Botrytis sinoallii]